MRAMGRADDELAPRYLHVDRILVNHRAWVWSPLAHPRLPPMILALEVIGWLVWMGTVIYAIGCVISKLVR